MSSLAVEEPALDDLPRSDTEISNSQLLKRSADFDNETLHVEDMEGDGTVTKR